MMQQSALIFLSLICTGGPSYAVFVSHEFFVQIAKDRFCCEERRVLGMKNC